MPEETAARVRFQELSPDWINENDYQPREFFDEESLADLAASIKLHGILQPILVRPDPVDPDRFQLIAGERRLRACRMLNLETIPSVIIAAEDLHTLELALVENLQRANLNPIEEAHAYSELIKSFNLTQETVAQRVGKSRESVTNSLRLLNLPESIQELIRSNELTAGHARALVGLVPESKALSLARRIVSDSLSVRDVERLVASEKAPSQSKSAVKQVEPHHDPYLRNLEALLQEHLQTKARIIRNKNGKGRIEIEFYDNSQLTSLFEKMRIRFEG
ncbi:MAG TPA: ParB/RepB/Spo0J family partition protein [bacterium]|nr:ParB/RepB/Spo0J family partition protein [bacterium]HQP97524.1 ParB/RepB/Spo0J family partition protein [bacterium]